MDFKVNDDICINTKFSHPIIDDGFRWCRLQEGYVECAYTDRWNECPYFKPVREAKHERGIKYPSNINKRVKK
jgi:hypothetical protein